MTEQFAFDKVCRQGGAIYFDHGAIFTQARIVNGPSHQLLAGSRLAENQDRRIAAGNLLYFIEHVFERIALTDYFFVVVFQFNLCLQIGSFRFQEVL